MIEERATLEALEVEYRRLPPPPRNAGTVALVVARPATDERRTPERCSLTPADGVVGDRWSQRPDADLQAQVTVMRADVARLLCDGQPLSLFGDNLLVELDISESNLPAGTRLRVGSALCEVTPKPHTGCSKFMARFGHDALRLTAAPQFRSDHLRGIHLRVLDAGEVSPGDPIEVVSRPEA